MRKQKGITLIALVITIIVLIILAGISIQLLLGENGIITKAKEAKISTNKASAREKVEIAVMGSYEENGKLDMNTLKNNLKNTDGISESDNITGLPAKIEIDGYKVIIEENGNVKFEDEEEKIEEGPAIYARLYTKNDNNKEEVLILSSRNDNFSDYSDGLTLKRDCGNISKVRYNSYEDFKNTAQFKEFFESLGEYAEEYSKMLEEEWKEDESLREMINQIPLWLKIGIGKGLYWYNENLCEVKIIDEIFPISTKDWFSLTGLKRIEGLTNLNTSKVKDMSGMFYDCEGLTTLDLSSFDTSNVITMSDMFGNCSELTNLVLTNFDTRNVKNMSAMFESCRNLTTLDLRNFVTDNVKDMSYMFYNCKKLTTIDLRNFNTSNVLYMSSMFDLCEGMSSLYLKNFDTSKVRSINSMFKNCKSLEKLDLSSFNTSNVESFRFTFNSCPNLTEILVGENWIVDSEADTDYMFDRSGTSKVTYIDTVDTGTEILSQ